MNQVSLLGRVSREPTQGVSKAGKPYARVNIAVDIERRSEGQQNNPPPWWISVMVFSERQVNAAMQLTKGQPVAVSGRLERSWYQPDTGPQRENWTLWCDFLNAATHPPAQQGRPQGQQRRQPNEPVRTVPRDDQQHPHQWDGDESDIPF